MLPERDRIVVPGIFGAEDQGHTASAGFLEEFLELVRTLLQLSGVALPELVPFRRVMPKPFS